MDGINKPMVRSRGGSWFAPRVGILWVEDARLVTSFHISNGLASSTMSGSISMLHFIIKLAENKSTTIVAESRTNHLYQNCCEIDLVLAFREYTYE